MNCNPINIVWIERGIILVLIDYFINNYKFLLKKNVIIDNKKYRQFFRLLFPKLVFNKYTSHSNNNFYVNIRRIIKQQDIVIDYLDNYDETIPSNNVNLVPWFDINDILIIYYHNNKNTPVNKYRLLFNQLICQRGNINNSGFSWDVMREKQVLVNYTKINPQINWNKIFYIINTFFRKNLRKNIINHYIYMPYNVNTNKTDNIVINENYDEDKMTDFLKTLDKKLSIMIDSF